jgi:hypothetical protein
MKHALLPFETKRDPHRLADWTEQLRVLSRTSRVPLTPSRSGRRLASTV